MIFRLANVNSNTQENKILQNKYNINIIYNYYKIKDKIRSKFSFIIYPIY